MLISNVPSCKNSFLNCNTISFPYKIAASIINFLTGTNR
jgi:hypothetical protein